MGAARSVFGGLSRAVLLRAVSAVGSSIVFGVVAHALLPTSPLVSAFVLAFCFGFLFLVGTGYRILLAAASGSVAGPTSASWTGAASAVSAGVLLAVWTVGEDRLAAARLLVAYALAINAAYLPAKIACLEAGCCTAVRRLPRWGSSALDLRSVEAVLTALAIVVSVGLLAAGRPLAAAAVGVSGHLIVRLLSRFCRERLVPGERFLQRGYLEFSLISILLITILFYQLLNH